MALKDILAISGKPGLYKFISQGRNGIIVESLNENKRIHAPATAKISALEDIAIFTDEEEVPLNEVFKKVNEKEDGGKAIDHKSKPEELKAYMADVLPTYDRDKVYVSDLKKLFNWYNLLHEMDLLSFEEEEDEVKEDNEEETTTENKSSTSDQQTVASDKQNDEDSKNKTE